MSLPKRPGVFRIASRSKVPRPTAAVPRPSSCRHCASPRITGHGAFQWKSGTRRQRFICQDCGKTFNWHTGTPLHYLKKRDAWYRQGPGLGQGLSVRGMAAALGVRVPTAFRWRHRLLAALGKHSQPSVDGCVAVDEAYVPYSEKGRRHGGPTTGAKTTPMRVRRFVDKRPSCVMLAAGGGRQTMNLLCQGRPESGAIYTCLKRLLAPGAHLLLCGRAAYADACRRLRVHYREAAGHEATTPRATVESLRRRLHGWLGQFYGVATRYLGNYLVWLRLAHLSGAKSPEEAGEKMLAAAQMLARTEPLA